VAELLHTLVQLVIVLGEVIVEVVALLAPWALLIAWIAWWLGAVNWRRTWVVLGEGGWAPLVLLMLLAARVWASLAPGEVNVFGLAMIGNFWWQLGAIALLVGLTLFCGWLQLVLDLVPPEINLEPPAAAADAQAHH
jgi:hypothetical protein